VRYGTVHNPSTSQIIPSNREAGVEEGGRKKGKHEDMGDRRTGSDGGGRFCYW